jgi:UDP-glucose 4-epimerase
MKTKCLLTGGAGFLGLHLATGLAKAGYDVTILDKAIPPKSKGINSIKGDFKDSQTTTKALKGKDILFHFAWSSVPADPIKNVQQDVSKNRKYTIRLFELAAKLKIKKVIFPSSGGSVYGNVKKIPIRETQKTNPISPYATSKLAVEKYIYLFHETFGVDYLILRISNPYGPRQSPDRNQGLIPKLIANALKGEETPIFGSTKAIRDYIYIGDVVSAILKLVKNDVKNDTFNIGSGKGRTIDEIIKGISKVVGVTPKIILKPERHSDVFKNALSIAKIKRKISWKPQTDLKKGLKLTLDWIKERD